jgi:hypothetical protein
MNRETKEALMQTTQTRELDYRSGDGLEVSLLWSPDTNRLTVLVSDTKAGDGFELEVEGHEAMDAFHHPYAYAAAKGLHFIPLPTPNDPIHA